MMKLDMHVHTKYSRDCKMEPRDVIKVARAKGLDGIAVTDHNTIKGGCEVKKLSNSFEVIIGSEINTNKGEVIGYFLNEEVTSRDFEDVVDVIRTQGGITCIPHPYDIFRLNRLTPTKEILKFIDCIEVFNSRSVLNLFNKKAEEFARKNGLARTAGSDAHYLAEIGRGGIVVDTLEDIIRAKRVKIFGNKTPLLKLFINSLRRIY